MKYKSLCSPFRVKLDRINKTITIKYNEAILEEPGVAENFKQIEKILIPVVEDSLKNQA